MVLVRVSRADAKPGGGRRQQEEWTSHTEVEECMAAPTAESPPSRVRYLRRSGRAGSGFLNEREWRRTDEMTSV